MKHEVYTGEIFCMEINPETKRKTIRLEIELDDNDFDIMKEIWCDSNEVDLKFID